MRLAAFRAGCKLDAVDEVLRTSWDHLDDPFDVLQRLVEDGSVLVEEPPRYRLPEAMRKETLAQASLAEIDVAMAGLFDWADGFCAQVAEGTTGQDQETWFDRADRELDNVSDAVAYGAARPPLRSRTLRMVFDLRHFWAVRGHYALGLSLLEPNLPAGSDVLDTLRVGATNLAGVLAMSMGDLDAAERHLTEGLMLARQHGDIMAQGRGLGNLGMIAWERMDFAVAHDAFSEASVLFETAKEWGSVGTARLNLGYVLIDMERLDAARDALEASLEPLRAADDRSGLAYATGNLGYLALVRGRRDESVRLVRASLDAFGRLGDWKGTINTLVSAATLLASTDLGSAAMIRGAIEAMSLREGMASTPRDDQRLLEIDRTLEEAPNAAALRSQRLKGLAMSPGHGIEYALSALSAISPKNG